jgi:FAD/FMN-containing dehydrogenase
MISTNKFRNITIHDDYEAVTVGSGVAVNDIYSALKEHGRIIVGPNAATVHVAGGYVQGGGHSALSPTFGLAADNTLGKYHVLVYEADSLTMSRLHVGYCRWSIHLHKRY